MRALWHGACRLLFSALRSPRLVAWPAKIAKIADCVSLCGATKLLSVYSGANDTFRRIEENGICADASREVGICAVDNCASSSVTFQARIVNFERSSWNIYHTVWRKMYSYGGKFVTYLVYNAENHCHNLRFPFFAILFGKNSSSPLAIIFIR